MKNLIFCIWIYVFMFYIKRLCNVPIEVLDDKI